MTDFSHKVTLHFKDIKDEILTINYNIFNTDIAKRWSRVVEYNKKQNRKIKSRIQSTTIEDEAHLKEKLNLCIHTINEVYDKKLPICDNLNIDEKILNYLHEEFEKYGDRKIENAILDEAFLLLNNLIHEYEDLNDLKIHKRFPNMMGLFNYFPVNQPYGWIPIQPPEGNNEKYYLTKSDYLYMTTQFRWGGLYLGYNTLGKDYFAVGKNNDIEVLERDQVRPQKLFSSEFYTIFSSESYDSPHSLIVWDKWYKSLSKELREKVPIESRVDLGLGRIWLGQIDLHSLPFREKIEKNFDYWNTPNSEARSKWNTEVFKKIKSLVDLEFHYD